MDFGPLVAGVFFVLGGIFVMVTVIFRWDKWYKDLLSNRVARKILGERGAIGLQIFAGIIAVIMGIFMLIWFVFDLIELMASE